MSDSSEAALTLPDPPPEVLVDERGAVRLTGSWTLLALRTRMTALMARLRELAGDPSRSWDLRGIARLDSAGALTIVQSWGTQRPGQLLSLPEHAAVLAPLAAAAGSDVPRAIPWWSPLLRLGQGALGFLRQLSDVVALSGRLVLDLVQIARQPALIPWREISANLFRTGAQALGITGLVGFLVGVTLAYLTARQLQAYGADIFLINILGVSIPRELGPLLAAIIVAGRSGSSMTAQLGVMRVTQELDALSVMGISHTVRLVLPKVVALAVALPLVVVWTSAVMLLGGMVAAQAELGLDPVQFIQGLPAAVPVANLWLGWAKAAIFGAVIALLACHFGLRIQPNTESLGAGVTQSVVISITSVIVVDAVFAVLFSNVGL